MPHALFATIHSCDDYLIGSLASEPGGLPPLWDGVGQASCRSSTCVAEKSTKSVTVVRIRQHSWNGPSSMRAHILRTLLGYIRTWTRATSYTFFGRDRGAGSFWQVFVEDLSGRNDVDVSHRSISLFERTTSCHLSATISCPCHCEHHSLFAQTFHSSCTYPVFHLCYSWVNIHHFQIRGLGLRPVLLFRSMDRRG